MITVPFFGDHSFQVVYVDGSSSFVPVISSVKYTVYGDDGEALPDFVNVSVSTNSVTVASTITLTDLVTDPAPDLVCYRTVVVSASKPGDIPWRAVYRFRFLRPLNLMIDAAQVRSYIGLNSSELPDDDVDLVRGYLEVADLLGIEVLEEKLATVGLDRIKANDLVLLKTVLNLGPSLDLRVAQKEGDGTLSFARFTKIDFTRILAAAAAQFGSLLAELLETTVADPVLLIVSSPADPVTGA